MIHFALPLFICVTWFLKMITAELPLRKSSAREMLNTPLVHSWTLLVFQHFSHFQSVLCLGCPWCLPSLIALIVQCTPSQAACIFYRLPLTWDLEYHLCTNSNCQTCPYASDLVFLFLLFNSCLMLLQYNFFSCKQKKTVLTGVKFPTKPAELLGTSVGSFIVLYLQVAPCHEPYAA